MPPRPKRWLIAPRAPQEYLSQFTNLNPLVAQILYNRGVAGRADATLFLGGQEESANPFALPDMSMAVNRIRRALREAEPMAVYGDFDADGVTATALLVQTIEALGGCVLPYIPDRVDEGYGLNEGALRELAEKGVTLVITVDCGIRARDQVSAARGLGVDVVITDHHAPTGAVPDAVAVVGHGTGSERSGPGEELAGVGVAYRLAQALLRSQRQSPINCDHVPLGEEDLLDLVALGTVADLVPLRGENRSLVRRGLDCLNRMERPGLRALCRQVGLRPGSITARTVGYVLGPRLNAAGRLSKAHVAYGLLTTSDPAEAQRLAVRLDGLNRERRRVTKEAHDLARRQIESASDDGALLFAASPQFPLGVVGLVASRLLDEFYRPSVVVRIDDDMCRGSCRSVEGFHITNALDGCRDLLFRHGGHAAAAGFRVRRQDLGALEDRLRGIAAARLRDEDLQPMLRADAEVSLSEMTWDLLEALSALEPCGSGNTAPIFVSRGVRVREPRAVGRDGSHLKLTLSDGRAAWDAIAFRQGAWAGHLPPVIDVAYHLELNEWRGRRRLQLNVQDLRPAEPESR